jgi:hypothetical protein
MLRLRPDTNLDEGQQHQPRREVTRMETILGSSLEQM